MQRKCLRKCFLLEKCRKTIITFIIWHLKILSQYVQVYITTVLRVEVADNTSLSRLNHRTTLCNFVNTDVVIKPWSMLRNCSLSSLFICRMQTLHMVEHILLLLVYLRVYLPVEIVLVQYELSALDLNFHYKSVPFPP